ncbi:MAG: sensor domain-containing diguanylate cyclase [Porticoccaceae bacterium]|jgi:diguanylate cyclase (GGDEF)-like protein/PAS domain S-box-containing protein|nr:sensor domain-containing diguanylate cyclase [Porticoccaceae bacterium]MEA3298807.1 sensor domain-containing diguanylate cyclase [Pseudomonadota bacterium]HLS99021.1 sensor domain-containing diguanylate cyclase [Porticoccaceae bacterium]
MKTDKTLTELIELIPDAALMIDQQGAIVLVNSLLAAMFGYGRGQLLGAPLDSLIPEDARPRHREHLAGFFARGENRPMGRGLRFLGLRQSGETFPVEIMLSHFRQGGEPYALAFVRDASAYQSTEEKIRRELEQERALALSDHLTGLGNRRAFTHELEQDIVELRDFGWQFAVSFIDLDDFKQVNDSLGHGVGDNVLQDVARLIRAGCRGSDFVARIGGDEFATIHPGATLADAIHILERVRASIVADMQAHHWPVTLSMGVCHCDQRFGNYSVAAILAAADRAMYQAKQQGKNQIRVAVLDAPPATSP